VTLIKNAFAQHVRKGDIRSELFEVGVNGAAGFDQDAADRPPA